MAFLTQHHALKGGAKDHERFTRAAITLLASADSGGVGRNDYWRSLWRRRGSRPPAARAQPIRRPAPTSPPAQQVGATATPLPTQAPPAAEVTGEGRKLVVLTESFGNEVWDPKFESGDKHVWHFPLHSHMITTDDELNYTKDGLATDWSVSEDGNSISWTIREDAMFHNGDPVTPEDAAWYLRYIQDDGARSVVRIRIWRLVAADGPNEDYEGDNTAREKEGHARVTGPNEVTMTFVPPDFELHG